MVNKILVVDFGSQYNQLIVRRIRELGVYSELVPHTISLDQIKNDPAIKGIIFSGGPNSVYAHNAPKIDSQIYQLAIPILGICYGMQLMAKQLGGKVSNAKHHEYGRTNVNICESNPLNSKLAKIQQV
jgi:GMP synthase (glutamine-hydrolysing)